MVVVAERALIPCGLGMMAIDTGLLLYGSKIRLLIVMIV